MSILIIFINGNTLVSMSSKKYTFKNENNSIWIKIEKVFYSEDEHFF